MADGGYWDNIPVGLALRGGAEHIIAVDLDSIFSRRPTLSQAKDLKLIRSYWNLGPMLVFDKSQIARNIRLGYLDTMKQFDVYEGIAYTFIKGSFLHIASRNTPYMTALNKACGLKFSPKPSQREALTLARIQGYLSKRYRITHSRVVQIFFVPARNGLEKFLNFLQKNGLFGRTLPHPNKRGVKRSFSAGRNKNREGDIRYRNTFGRTLF